MKIIAPAALVAALFVSACAGARDDAMSTAADVDAVIDDVRAYADVGVITARRVAPLILALCDGLAVSADDLTPACELARLRAAEADALAARGLSIWDALPADVAQELAAEIIGRADAVMEAE